MELHASPAAHPLCPSPGQQPARHRNVVGSQIRPESVAPQSASRAHPQRIDPSGAVTQVGASPLQPAGSAVVHSTQRPTSPPLVAHAGVGAWQSPGVVAEHRRHVRDAGSQIGVDPAQSALLVQPTQRLLATSQTVPWQSAFVRHCTQWPALAPAPAHTGSPGSMHSPLREGTHARHTCAVASHTGCAESGQSRLARHATHVLVVVSQIGVAALHCVLVLQATHRPAFAPTAGQAGRVGSMAAHCASE